MTDTSSSKPSSGGGLAIHRGVIENLIELTDDPDFLNEVIELYLEDSVQRIRDLASAFEQGDIKTLGKIAHTLKSASANIGALQLAEHCKAVELQARVEASCSGLRPLIDAIVASHKAAILDLRHIQGSRGA